MVDLTKMASKMDSHVEELPNASAQLSAKLPMTFLSDNLHAHSLSSKLAWRVSDLFINKVACSLFYYTKFLEVLLQHAFARHNKK